jgi:phosphoglycolate phosphatase
MGTYDTVIFDLDGTLLNTLEDLTDAVNYALEKHGFSTHSLEDVRRFVGNGVKRLMELAIPGGLESQAFEETFADFKEYYSAHCHDKTRPYEDILEVLQELKAKGYKIAIVSNKMDEAVGQLRTYYFDGLIDVAVGESEEVRKKPAPDTVFRALELLGSKAENSVYVGDSEVDIATAQNANMTCFSCLWGFREEALLRESGATYLIDQPMNLLKLL